MSDEIFITTIIPTIGRDSLTQVVESALAQVLPVQADVIVVNDSGDDLHPAAWHADPRVRIVSSNRGGRSAARNLGAASARGGYLHFLDDDDWLIPGGLAHLVQMAQREQHLWIYGDT